MAVAIDLGRGNWCNACGSTLTGHAVFRLSLEGETPGAQYYCVDCAHARLRCASCHRALDAASGHLFALAGQAGRLYCPDCWARPHCHACGRPVGEISYQRPDGRVFCDRCHATAIYDPVLAEALYARVQETARRALGMELNVGAQLHLASREQIVALRNAGPGGLPPETDNPGADYVGLFLYQWRLRAIYVEYGLPQIFFCEVLAHEYAHVWQAEHAPLLTDPELREGFAEWVAYKVVESWGCGKRLERFRQRQDLYGAGLRRMLAWEAATGVAGVLERIGRER
jgi:hypothetical protein